MHAQIDAKMSAIRRAMLITLSERYFTLGASFLAVVLVSRLLTPEEIGLSVIGMAIVGFALAAREFASPNFLIQRHNLDLDEIRRAFAVMLALTLAIVLVLIAAAPLIGWAYGEERIVPYLYVVSVGILVELIYVPVVSLLRREMAFGKVAIINVSNAATNAVLTIVLALLGFSNMSFAWAWMASAVVSSVLALCFYRDHRIFRPLMGDWRDMLTFGGYNGATVLLHRLYESLPVMALGRILSLDAVAFFNRGLMVCQLPDKVFLQGVVSVILPAFSAEVRNGRSLREPYLRAVALITGFQWPALVVLAWLAHPIVQILFGAQWFAIVPLVQVIAIATMFSFSFELNYPVLIAMGAVRDSFLRGLVVWPVSAVILTSFAFFGLQAVAWSLLLVMPFQAVASLHFVRRHVSISWIDIGAALWRSLAVAGMSASGPAAVIGLAGFRVDLSLGDTLIAIVLAGVGWLGGLLLTGHPLIEEIRKTAAGLGLTRLIPRRVGSEVAFQAFSKAIRGNGAGWAAALRRRIALSSHWLAAVDGSQTGHRLIEEFRKTVTGLGSTRLIPRRVGKEIAFQALSRAIRRRGAEWAAALRRRIALSYHWVVAVDGSQTEQIVERRDERHARVELHREL
jgi:O-antigen/teichoic acid export membrane protein